jgi:FkbM family methyltransferase
LATTLREYANKIMLRYRFRVFLPGRVPRGCSVVIDLDRLFEKQNRKLNVIFDIGANVGQTAKWLGNVFPGAFIHSFEPVAGTFEVLRENVQNWERVTPHNLAIGATSGKIRMEINQQSSEWSRVADGDSEAAGGPFEECEMKTVRDVCETLALSGVDLLKIDAEGHEIHVLNGARELLERGEIASVYAEVDFAPDGAHGNFFEIHDFLVNHQFNLYGLYDYSRWQGAPAHAFCNGLWLHSSLWR